MNSRKNGLTAGIRLLSMVMLMFALASHAHAQLGGKPGAFSRMGFGTRGIGMGNAMTAVTTGELVSYYNPALTPFNTVRTVSAAFGLLSLSRSLNFVSFTAPLPPHAGLTIGLINAGVSNIDGRDADGRQTGALRTSENAAFLGFGLRVSPKVALGVNIKLLYYRLYTDVSSTTIGFDAGVLFIPTEALTLAATVRDLGSRYRWDTSQLFGSESGRQTEARFPQLYSLGASYSLPDSIALVAAAVEFSNSATLLVRAGVEVPLIPELTVRAGVDRIDLKEKGNGIRPSAGFTLRKSIGTWTPQVGYAFVLEPFSPAPMHFISLGVIL